MQAIMLILNTVPVYFGTIVGVAGLFLGLIYTLLQIKCIAHDHVHKEYRIK